MAVCNQYVAGFEVSDEYRGRYGVFAVLTFFLVIGHNEFPCTNGIVTDSQKKLELTVGEWLRLVLQFVCDDTTMVARSPVFTRERARTRRSCVLRALAELKKNSDTH